MQRRPVLFRFSPICGARLCLEERQQPVLQIHTKKNKSLQTMADGSETIWGLKPLDDFMGYAPATDDTPEKPARLR